MICEKMLILNWHLNGLWNNWTLIELWLNSDVMWCYGMYLMQFNLILWLNLPDTFDLWEPVPFLSSSVDWPSVCCRKDLSAFEARAPTSSPSPRRPEIIKTKLIWLFKYFRSLKNFNFCFVFCTEMLDDQIERTKEISLENQIQVPDHSGKWNPHCLSGKYWLIVGNETPIAYQENIGCQ